MRIDENGLGDYNREFELPVCESTRGANPSNGGEFRLTK